MFNIVSYLKYCGITITDKEMIEKTLPHFTHRALLCNNSTAFKGRGRGRGRGQGRGRGSYYDNSPKTVNHHHKRNRDDWNQDNNNKWERSSNSANNLGSSCHRCGMKGHWYKTCRTPDYFVKLCQESRDRKGKEKEVNLIENPLNEFTHFGAPDFHNYLGDIDGDYTTAKGTNYVDQDPIKEYTHLGESDFYHGLTRDSNEQEMVVTREECITTHRNEAKQSCLKMGSDEAKQRINIEEVCILDCGTIHTILKDERFFSKIKPTETVVNTISVQ
ncbi:hypothetical protein QQ045_012561 [Rhodiola kirilowii]